MGNLFSGLDFLGLGKLSSIDVYEKEDKEEGHGKQQNHQEKPPEFTETDFIFEKTYLCPVCDKEFKSKIIKTGKAKLLSADTDLRPKYQPVDVLKYDAIACPVCGYAALSRYFNYMTSAQAKLIKNEISVNFTGLAAEGEIVTYDEAITKHRLALVNAVVKRAKSSEKAYTCLKTAWLLRGKAENLPEDTPDFENVKKKTAAEEREFLENAYNGFLEAYPKEIFPMCGMDENTVSYLIAAIAREIGRYEDAGHWASRVIASRGANNRLKEKARELKELIIKDKKGAGSNEGTIIHHTSK